MSTTKQQSIPGTEPPRNTDLDEAIEQLRDAEAAHKRAGEAVQRLRAVLVQRMVESETARYDYVDLSGGQWAATLKLSDPGVQLKFVGSRSDGE